MKFIRVLLAVLAAYALAYGFAPYFPASLPVAAALPMAIIFTAVFGILAQIAISRRERLKEATATELNKLRRIYHLGKNLGTAPYLRSWFTDLHGFIYDYLGGFEKFDLSDYEKGNPLFRRIAYHVYTVPTLHEVKEEVLYDELLEATAAVSDARQKIATLYRIRYSYSHWLELLLLLIAFTASVVASVADGGVFRFLAANLLAGGYILAHTFFAHDIWTKDGDRRLAQDYVKNITRLELRRG
jgi:hypothetical protein